MKRRFGTCGPVELYVSPETDGSSLRVPQSGTRTVESNQVRETRCRLPQSEEALGAQLLFLEERAITKDPSTLVLSRAIHRAGIARHHLFEFSWSGKFGLSYVTELPKTTKNLFP